MLVTNHDIAVEARSSIVELMPNLAYVLTIPHDTIVLSEWTVCRFVCSACGAYVRVLMFVPWRMAVCICVYECWCCCVCVCVCTPL